MKDDRYKVELMTGLEVYKIGREAIITLQPSTGYISVSCPWHDEFNGCHWWGSRGGRTLHEFLIELNKDYVMGKLFVRSSLEEYDHETTINRLKQHVIDIRKMEYISKDGAREILDDINQCDYEEDVIGLAGLTGIDCPYEFIHTKPKHCVNWFWDEVWQSFISYLKEQQNKK